MARQDNQKLVCFPNFTDIRVFLLPSLMADSPQLRCDRQLCFILVRASYPQVLVTGFHLGQAPAFRDGLSV